jgi:hypothetical protein
MTPKTIIQNGDFLFATTINTTTSMPQSLIILVSAMKYSAQLAALEFIGPGPADWRLEVLAWGVGWRSR